MILDRALYPLLAVLAGALLSIAGTAHAADTIPRNGANAIGITSDAKCAVNDSICSVVALLKGLYYNGLSAGSAIIGKVGIDQTTPGATNGVTIAPTSATAAGITSVVSASAENNHVLKNAAGNLYSAYAANLTGTGGFLVLLNATSSPGDGAITPLDCAPLPANGYASINYRPGPAKVYSTGITAVVTSAATCFTKTTGVITAFISGDVQ